MRVSYKKWETAAGGIRNCVSSGRAIWTETVLLLENLKIYGPIKNQFFQMYWLWFMRKGMSYE